MYGRIVRGRIGRGRIVRWANCPWANWSWTNCPWTIVFTHIHIVYCCNHTHCQSIPKRDKTRHRQCSYLRHISAKYLFVYSRCNSILSMHIYGFHSYKNPKPWHQYMEDFLWNISELGWCSSIHTGNELYRHWAYVYKHIHTTRQSLDERLMTACLPDSWQPIFSYLFRLGLHILVCQNYNLSKETTVLRFSITSMFSSKRFFQDWFANAFKDQSIFPNTFFQPIVLNYYEFLKRHDETGLWIYYRFSLFWNDILVL